MSRKEGEVLDALKPGHRLHEYRIERVLGHGGFGITYLAYDVLLDAPFAIKEFLPPDLAARGDGSSITVRSGSMRERFTWAKKKFLAEARVLARFHHPNLVRVNRIFESHGTVYFVMEFVAGATLDAWLKSRPPLDEAQVRATLLPLASGLAEVHAAGMLHRDVKPGNIIIREDGTPILIDFGAARHSYGAASRSVLNVVTAGYAPVEQYSDTGQQGPWTDIYALGAVAYLMVCGHKPPDAVNRLRNDPLPPAAREATGRYSPELLTAIDWALEVHPDDRPRSLEDWQRALTGAPARRDTPPDSAPPPAAPNAGKLPWSRWLAAASVLLALGGAAAWMIRPAPPAETAAVDRAPADVDPLPDLIAQGEAQLAAGEMAPVRQLINARLTRNPDDAVGLVLRGHLAFADGQRAAGIADYTIALAAEPGLSGNRLIAANLVSALDWTTTAAERLIEDHVSEAMLDALAARAVETGAQGRAHARRILGELGRDQRVDALKFARVELVDRRECEPRIAAVRTIGRLGVAADIELLQAQDTKRQGNACLEHEISAAVETLRRQTPG